MAQNISEFVTATGIGTFAVASIAAAANTHKYCRSRVKTKHLRLYFCKGACPVHDLLTAASDMHCHAAACKQLKLKTQLLDVIEL